MSQQDQHNQQADTNRPTNEVDSTRIAAEETSPPLAAEPCELRVDATTSRQDQQNQRGDTNMPTNELDSTRIAADARSAPHADEPCEARVDAMDRNDQEALPVAESEPPNRLDFQRAEAADISPPREETSPKNDARVNQERPALPHESIDQINESVGNRIESEQLPAVIEGSPKSVLLRRLALAMYSHPKLGEAARACGISYSSAWRIRQTDSFKREYSQVSKEGYEQAKGMLQEAAPLAVATLTRLLGSKKEDIQLKAADRLLTHARATDPDNEELLWELQQTVQHLMRRADPRIVEVRAQ